MNSRKLAGLAVAVTAGLLLVWQLLSTPEPRLAYTLEEIEYLNHGKLSLHVVVDSPATPGNLQTVARQVVAKTLEQDREFSALEINFYDYPEFIGFGPTLGRAVYGPGGMWGVASQDDMEFSWELKNKDWTLQLTPIEVEIWSAWRHANDSSNAQEATADVARQYDQTPISVEQILVRYRRWLHDDN